MVVIRNAAETSQMVTVLVTEVVYSGLELNSTFTVHPFWMYPVVPTKFPLIYKAHLLAVANTAVFADNHVMVTVVEAYILFILALVTLEKENESGVVSSVPL